MTTTTHDLIAERIKLLASERDAAYEVADSLRLNLAELQSEMAHLRHFKSSIERELRNLPRRFV